MLEQPRAGDEATTEFLFWHELIKSNIEIFLFLNNRNNTVMREALNRIAIQLKNIKFYLFIF